MAESFHLEASSHQRRIRNRAFAHRLVPVGASVQEVDNPSRYNGCSDNVDDDDKDDSEGEPLHPSSVHYCCKSSFFHHQKGHVPQLRVLPVVRSILSVSVLLSTSASLVFYLPRALFAVPVSSVQQQQQQQQQRESFCRHAFRHGVEPRTPARQQKVQNRTLLRQWTDWNCDELVCEPSKRWTPFSVAEPCPWTSFAVDTFLPTGKKAADLCNATTAAAFFSDPVWDKYSFADFFKGVWFDYRTNALGTNWTEFGSYLSQTFPGSLIDEYHQASLQEGTSTLNFTLLHRIVQRRAAQLPPNQLPSPDTLLLHLRLGDVVDAAPESVAELLRRQHYYFRVKHAVACCEEPWHAPGNTSTEFISDWNAYVLPLGRFSNLDLREYKHVVIMGSAHSGELWVKNDGIKTCLYTHALQEYLLRFSSTGAGRINVTLRLGQPPDQDMVYASQVKTFIQSGGAFSAYIGILVKKFGGEVIKFHTTTYLSEIKTFVQSHALFTDFAQHITHLTGLGNGRK